MKLETMALGPEDKIIRLGGFFICTDESDLPNESLFPPP
jgi:hypothetical protein